jgi:hypothetical protein
VSDALADANRRAALYKALTAAASDQRDAYSRMLTEAFDEVDASTAAITDLRAQLARAEQAGFDYLQRAELAEAQLAKVEAARDAAIREQDEARIELRHWRHNHDERKKERGAALTERDWRVVERDRAIAERDAYKADCDRLRALVESFTSSMPLADVLQMRLDMSADMDSIAGERDAAIRELERWRHGVTIEGDFVCPNELAATNLEAEVARLTRERERDEARAQADAWREHLDIAGTVVPRY